jgi:amino acid adenylation domain-containing protein/non-ribosomal peptide synthase protein (TIGR01720 family)
MVSGTEQFWRDYLKGFIAPTPLVIDRINGRPLDDERGLHHQEVQLTIEETRGLERVGQEQGVTMHTLIVGAWALLLSRYSGEGEVLIGTTSAGRSAGLTGIEEMVGLFINTLPLRVEVDERQGLSEWWAELQAKHLEVRRHEYTPLVRIQGWSEIARGLPLFESLLLFESNTLEASLGGAVPGTDQGDKGEPGGSWAEREVRMVERTSYPLTITAVAGRQLNLRVLYERQRLSGGAVRRLLGHLQTILRSFAAAPERLVGQVGVLSEGERERAIVEWNQTRTAARFEQCLHSFVEAQVERTPEAVAVEFEGQSLSYEELNRRANRLAHHLSGLGVAPDQIVGVCAERSLELVVGLLGVLKAGGAYLPLDPELPRERVELMVSDAQVRVVLAQRKFRQVLPAGVAVVLLDGDEVKWADPGGLAASEERDYQQWTGSIQTQNPEVGVGPHHLAYVIYTSGSTGRPKGTLTEHRAISNNLLWMQDQWPLTPADRLLQKSPFSFDVSVKEFFWPLLSGARLVVARPGGHRDPGYLKEVIGGRGVTVTHFVPTMLQAFLEEEGLAEECRSLRLVMCGAEALTVGLQERFCTRLGALLLHLYGPTEAAIAVTGWECERDRRRSQVPLGRPMANVQIYILDQRGEVVPVGVNGELHIGGVAVARGYLRRAEQTAEKFIPDQYGAEAGGRLYRTGDVGRYLEDGKLEFVGRVDEQVKVRGYRIELGEIEAALRAHEGVKQSVVVARASADAPDSATGEKRLVAYVVGQPPAAPGNGATELNVSELRAYLLQRLPAYMVPSAFVMLDRLPLSANGKVDRLSLPQPDQLRPLLAQSFILPTTPVEKKLAEIWSQTLGLKQVGIHDKFFELGGDSILSIQLAAKANKAGLRFTSQQLFQRQTIAELATVVSTTTQTVHAEQGIITGAVPLTPIQCWLLERDVPEPHHYNMVMLFKLRKAMKPSSLKRAVRKLISHHDALRFNFRRDANGWHQSASSVDDEELFSYIDLSSLTETDQIVEMEKKANALQASLNLSAGSSIRVSLFDFGAQREGRLLIIVHHLVMDGVSWRILLEDLQTAYGQEILGKAICLPLKTTSYQYWSAQLTEYAQSATVEQELAYWLAEAGQSSSHLPLDDPEGTNTVASTDTVSLSLDIEETRSLLQDVPEVYHTQINDVLLTALAQACERWTGERVVLIDLEGHGREDIFQDVDLSRTIGWFTSIFPVRLDLGEARSEGAALKLIKEQLRRIPNRGIGFGVLRYLSKSPQIREQLRALPRSEVSFNYLGQFDQTLSADSPFAWTNEASGPPLGLHGMRSHLLKITGIITGNRLQVSWEYSRNVHHRATIDGIARDFMDALRSIITHCQSSQAGGYTESDFPLAKLDQKTLDRLLGADREIEDLYPLSPMQEGMLFHSLYAPHSGFYLTQLICTMPEQLDVAAFEHAWRQLLDNYSILRSAVLWQDLQRPLQCVRRRVTIPIEQLDWSRLSTEEQHTRLESFLESDRERGLDLSQAPLMRLTILKLAEATSQFIWSFHHVLLDGWGMPRVLKHLFAFYEASRRGEVLQVERPRPYKDFIGWLEQQDVSEAETFWRQQLKGCTAPTALGIDYNGGVATDDIAGYGKQVGSLTEEETRGLERVGQEQGVTMHTLIVGAWALLLSRYSGEGEVLIGTTSAGRSAGLTGIEEMVGLFINTLPLRVEVDERQGLSEWWAELQAKHLEVRRHEYTPLVRIQGWSEIARGLPLFESLLLFESNTLEASLGGAVPGTDQGDKGEPGGSWAEREVRMVERTSYPLTITAVAGRQLNLRVLYERQRLSGGAVRRLLGHLQTILRSFAAAPERLVGQVGVLSEGERERAIVEWNQTRTAARFEQCLHSFVEAQVERTPEAVAVEFEGQSLSYEELNRRANRLAHHLSGLGVAPDQIVGVCAERSLELVVGLLGVLKAGGAYLPLDPELPRERVELMVSDAQVRVVLAQRKFRQVLPAGVAVVLLDGDEVKWADPGGLAASEERDYQQWTGSIQTQNPEVGVGPHHLAYVIYTSGSTGRPKGTLTEHRAISNNLLWMQDQWPLTPADRLLQKSPFSFDVSVKEFFWPLLSGARLVVARPGGHRDPGYLKEVIGGRGVTVTHFVPTMLQAFLEEEGLAEECRSLRLVMCGAEALTVGLQERFCTRLGALLLHLYGPTEAAIAVTGWECERDRRRSQVPLGRPMANVQIYILDQRGEVVPVGVNGELHIGGVAVARGYLRRAEQTAEKFIPDQYGAEAGGRLYRTGDVGRYLEDGKLEFVGRVDEQVKVRGYRIELGEIEAALRAHEGVKQSVVVARASADAPDSATGEKRLVAYVVGQPPAAPGNGATELNVSELRAYLLQRLPAYMVPSAFVMLDRLPLSANGKVDRLSLPQPDQLRPLLAQSFIPPRSPYEEILADMWAEILHVERVGAHDNFFELGGHSLLATRLVSRVRDSFHVEMPLLRMLFETPTVAGLAESIEKAVRSSQTLEVAPIRRARRDEALPLSFAQRRLWFLDRLEPESGLYNMSSALLLSGELNIAALEKSLNEIIRRHEILRTTFPAVEGIAVQAIAAAQPLTLSSADLSKLPTTEREEIVERLVSAEAQQPFSLTEGPLLRVELRQLAEEEHVLILTIHHIVSDAWSMEVFERELSEVYKAFSNGQPSPLPELPIQYADYAVWQRHWLEGESLQLQLSYWKQHLAGAPEVLQLPTDHPRPAIQTFRGRTQSFVFPQHVCEALKQLSQRGGSTLFMILLATFKALLHRYTGQDSIVVGTPIAGRNRSETESLMGFFVNTLPLHTDLSGNPSMRELLERVRETALGAYAHQDLPFERLVEELQPERNLNRNPLFQVVFVFDNASPVVLDLPGLTIDRLETKSETAKFDLTLFMLKSEQELSGRFEYNSDLFDEGTIARMAGHLQNLLTGILAHPDQSLASLPLLTPDEQQELIDWNKTSFNYEQALCLHQLCEAQAERTPDALAVKFGDEALTYRQLNRRANQLAHHLRKLGVGPETRVGICTERSVEMVVGLLGILKAGGAYLPLDSAYPRERLSFMLEDAQIRVLLTQERLGYTPPARVAHVIYLDADWETVARESSDNPLNLASLDNLAYVIYTSGSTGRPKGVEVPHRGLLNLVNWHQQFYSLTPADRATHLAGLSFDASVWELWPYLAVGASIHLVDDEVRQSPAKLVQWLAKESITHCFLPTPLAEMALAETWPPSMALKVLLTGGDKLHRGLGKELGFSLINHYGPTENSVVTTCGALKVNGEIGVPPPIGRPIANTQVYILDNYGRCVPVGVAGELHIGGVGLARGYLNHPELTAEKFIPNVFSSEGGARLYRTGDLTRYLPNGEIEFLGRIDHQVKVRGFRIELGEVEAVLDAYPGMRECVVVAREGLGEEIQLIAYTVAEKNGEGDVQHWLAYLKEKLPEHMIPAAFVQLDKLPLTPNGKVDRRALPAPERSRPELEKNYLAPRNALERTLAGIWSALLGLDQVGIHDNFFHLGGHSLLATQVISRIRASSEIELPLRSLFANPTIAELGEHIETLRWATEDLPAPLTGAAELREVGEL